MMQQHETRYLGKVSNREYVQTVVAIPGASLALGSTAIGLYVGLIIGGDIGEAVGGLVSTFAAGVAYGQLKCLAVELDRYGQVKLKFRMREHQALLVA